MIVQGRAIAASLVICALASPGLAQSPAIGAPSNPADVPAASNAPDATTLALSATFGSEGKPIRTGLIWRIFAEKGEGQPTLAGRSSAAAPTLSLAPGSYVVHV